MGACDGYSNKPVTKGSGNRFAGSRAAWIASVAALVAALAGAGCSGATSKSAVQPTSTIATSAPAASATTISPVASAAPPSTPAAATGPANGTLLGSYSFTLPRDGAAPIGTTAPTQAEILAGGPGPDIVWETDDGGSPLGTPGQDKIVSLPNGTTPTYAACKADTLVTNSETNSQGTAFCLIETTGDMAGITVQSVNLSQQPYDIVLQVTLWTNSA
jgi:hypothetical protein